MDWPKVLGSKGQTKFCEVILCLFHLWRTTQSVSTHNIVDRSRNFDYNIIFVPSLICSCYNLTYCGFTLFASPIFH